MAEFGFSSITIPTPQPYDDKDPQRQLENLCYVALQMLDQAKQAGFVMTDNSLEGVETKLEDLKWDTVLLDLWPLGKIYFQHHGPAVREG